MNEVLLIPILGILTGISIPLAVFIWLYHENKDKRRTVLEIAKHLDDPQKLDELMQIFEERKKEPIDYRRNGVITLFVGIGLYLFGYVWIGSRFRGCGHARWHHWCWNLDCRLPLPQHREGTHQCC